MDTLTHNGPCVWVYVCSHIENVCTHGKRLPDTSHDVVNAKAHTCNTNTHTRTHTQRAILWLHLPLPTKKGNKTRKYITYTNTQADMLHA